MQTDYAPKSMNETMIGIMFYLTGDKTLIVQELAALVGRSKSHIARSLDALRARGFIKLIDGNNCVLTSGFKVLEKHFAG